jgi:hypothetical protein
MRIGELALLCVALGCGESRSGAPHVDDGAGAAAGMSSGGLPGGGAPAGGASGMGAEMSACGGFSTQQCIDSCATDEPLGVAMECVDGGWHCPPGAMLINACPPESCYGILSQCCDSALGRDGQRECGPDGTLLACPDGFDAIERGGLCAPQGVGATSCDSLAGTACDNADFQCSEGGGCGRVTCSCDLDLSGSLVWTCQSPLC